MAFDPNQHMSKLKGKDYLEVKWRLVWFREEHPTWGIVTEIVRFDEQLAVVRASITDENGVVKAQGTKQEQPSHFSDYLEKAETGAIGRALAALGYGTQFAPELEEEERIVDSPVDRRPAKPAGIQRTPDFLANDQQLKVMITERKRRQNGMKPIMEALKAKGLPDLEGKPKEETDRLLDEYLHKLTVTDVTDIIHRLKELPFKSEGTKPTTQEGA